MTSSPLVLMSLLVSIVVVSYLSINNYSLRRENNAVNTLALRNVGALDKTLADCATNRDKLTESSKSLEGTIGKIAETKGVVEAAIGQQETEGAAAVAKVTEDTQKTTGELNAANQKLEALKANLTALGVAV